VGRNHVTPRVLSRQVEYSCEWLDVVAKDVDLGPPRGRERFWAVRAASEYTAVLAVTEDGRVPLVRQFRPAVEELVLELPSGSVDPGETPEDAVRRELLEETGFAASEIVQLGSFLIDSGRMETRQSAFFAPRVSVVADGPRTDEPLELTLVDVRELLRLVSIGEFRLLPHIAIVALAHLRGYLGAVSP
jgi:ADP-ribose pyrophosphatase